MSSPPSSSLSFFSKGSPLVLGDWKLNFLVLHGNILRLAFCKNGASEEVERDSSTCEKENIRLRVTIVNPTLILTMAPSLLEEFPQRAVVMKS